MGTNTPPPGNIIVAWNNIYLEAVRQIGGAPGPLARIGALMHLAMYEAINRFTPGSPYPSILKNVPIVVPLGATAEASATHAATEMLQKAVETYVMSTLAAQGGIPNPFDPFQLRPGAMAYMAGLKVQVSPKAAGKKAVMAANPSETFGKAVVAAVLLAFPDNLGLGLTPLLGFGEMPGEWRDTGSGPALTPRWGTVPLYLVGQPTTHYLPTVLSSPSAYPNLLHSPVYAAQVAETKLLGAAHSTTRTAEETEIAFFWANDLNKTSKPPGQLYTIVQTVAKQQGTLADKGTGSGADSGLLQTARLFAMVGTAMVNASIVAWQAKYYWPTKEVPLRLWRPETAIQLATLDGNPSTAADPAWQPLSAMTSGQRFSPNFPAFVSGHSTFGAAWAAAMQAFYDGRDNISFTATTEDPHAVKDENGIVKTRSFASFTQAALENGRSRIYLGVHYQFDATSGYEIGTKVGQDTAKAFTETKEAASELYEARKGKKGKANSSAALFTVQQELLASPAAIAGIKAVFIEANGKPVWLELTVITLCIWSFTLPSSIDEQSDKPGQSLGGPHRERLYINSPASLIGTSPVWKLLLDNVDGNAQPYAGTIRLVQGDDVASGQTVYKYIIDPHSIPAAPSQAAILFETLQFVAA